jgi:hypothetical protein
MTMEISGAASARLSTNAGCGFISLALPVTIIGELRRPVRNPCHISRVHEATPNARDVYQTH